MYDEISFLCVNAVKKSHFHVEITRKADRKCYIKFTLHLNGIMLLYKTVGDAFC